MGVFRIPKRVPNKFHRDIPSPPKDFPNELKHLWKYVWDDANPIQCAKDIYKIRMRSKL